MKVLKVLSLVLLAALVVFTPPRACAQALVSTPQVPVTLRWSQSADQAVAGYYIYYGSSARAQTNRVDAGATSAVTIPNLEAGITYYFYATAYNTNRVESDPSNWITYTPGPPAAPTNLTAKATTTQNIALQWQKASTDLTGFYVERSLDGSHFERVATVDSGVTTWMVTDRNFSAKNYPFVFRVAAYKGTQVSPYSNPAMAVTNTADLVVTALDSTPVSLVAGSPVRFSAVVRNQGLAATPQGRPLMVSFSVNGQPAVAWGYLTNTLAPGAAATVTAETGLEGVATWPAVAGTHTFTATVDTLNYLAESNENNNQWQTSALIPDANAPVVEVSLNKTTVAENDTDGAVLTVTRAGNLDAALTVLLDLGGTAQAGINYAAVPATVVIPAGSATRTVTVTPLADNQVSGDKTVTIGLQPSLDYQAGTLSATALTIADADADTDHDGMSDAAEAVAGTDPTDDGSNLKVLAFCPAPNGQLTIKWASVPGVSYHVMGRSLTGSGWTPISEGITATADTTTWTFTTTNTAGVYGIGL